MSQSLDAFAAAKLADLEERKLKRTLKADFRSDDIWITRAGRRYLSFACNDYLNLTHHPAVKEGAIAAIRRYGAGAGASRLITGIHPLLEELEARLAALKGYEAACVFGSGYLANSGIIPTLTGPGDLLLVDELAHACINAGAHLSGAHVERFRHNDLAHFAELLARHRGRYKKALAATDGVFSMDGDLAPLEQFSELCEAHDVWLMVDDAHGLGVLGEGGRGTASLFPKAHVPLAMGTLSKALGSYGGYVCASRPVVDLLKTRARTLVYSTGLPPGAAGAALAALDVIAADPELTRKPLVNARAFTAALNLPAAESSIVPLILGDPATALKASEALAEEGFIVTAIRPPTVPLGTARLRFAFTAQHPAHEIGRLADCCRALAIA
jgi:8-amino-7-oxononanoate synthase